jgi:hypothetical protein
MTNHDKQGILLLPVHEKKTENPAAQLYPVDKRLKGIAGFEQEKVPYRLIFLQAPYFIHVVRSYLAQHRDNHALVQRHES